MKSIRQLTNILRPTRTLTNTDTGLRRGQPNTTSSLIGENTVTKEELSDLTDRRRIYRTIENSREAFQIDPTVFSSILSMVIVTNSSYEIINDEDGDDAAAEHIREKTQPSAWDLDSLMDETLIKGMVDSKCFIRTWPNQENPSTYDVSMLAYDSKYYNFLELIDPTTGELLGYKQKATIYPVPENWENNSFDSLSKRNPVNIETNFQPDEVIHPKFMEQDGKADSLVFKALDYVDIKREIETMIPAMVRRASLSLGVEVGSPDTDLGITNKAEADNAVGEAASTFKEKEKKDVISHMYGVRPYMIGNGSIPDVIPLLNYLKQEIRQALLTPDSRFESASSNRAVAQEQLSGSMGQTNTIEYLQSWIRKYFEHQLINRELSLAGFEKDIGKVHIKFRDLEVDDDYTNAQIAQILETAYPSVSGEDVDIRINTYFKNYAVERQKQDLTQITPLVREQPVPVEPLTNAVIDSKGVVQPTLQWPSIVEKGRRVLQKEGVLY